MLLVFVRFAVTTLALLLIGRGLQSALLVGMPEPAHAVTSAATTKAVTVKDVLESNPRPPITSRASFPNFSYAEAFPGATDAPEVQIASFGEAPGLAERLKLPPVAERLPRNPAVVRGPDGIGRYGGVWRQCVGSAWHIPTKVCYESLVRRDPAGGIQPGLACRWEISDDCRVYTFHLRKGHRYSDGTPFTSHDIAFNCNVVIGSPSWGTPPNWMQPTDGTMLLYPEEFSDWPGFARRVCEEGERGAPSPGAQVWKGGEDDLRKLLRAMLDKPPSLDDAERATELLNGILQQGKFFDPAALAGVDLKSDIEALERKGASRLDAAEFARLNLLQLRQDLWRRAAGGLADFTPAETRQLNVLLFRAAFSGMVAPPQRTRARVECVPDASGDDSHIVRFTFRRPNPLLLDLATTFMFYRGMFESSRNVAAWHRDGLQTLAAEDFLDAKAFAAELVAKSPDAVSCEGRLWACLSSEGSALVKRLAAAETGSGENAELAREINLALAKPGYFFADALAKIDFEAEHSALNTKGYSRFSEAERVRWNELLLRADWLRRVKANGIGDLGAGELLRFNIAMFRAAHAAHVASNRETALNHAAHRSQPSYDSWVARLRSRGRYHPTRNPNAPVLTAWRLVSEPAEHVQRFVRNPYYYKVDAAGNQLPYLDEIQCEIESQKSIRVLKLRSGNVSFQTRDIDFSDFSVLKQNEDRGNYDVRLWANDYCGELTFYCLQAHKDPQYARLQADPRFRRALSLALNRQEMIDVVFKGLGAPAQYAVPEGSPYYNAKHANACVASDPAEANRLLDEIGLNKRAADGTRLFWDGQTPVVMDVNTTAERPLEAVQLACRYWQAVGINAQMKVLSQTTINRLINMGTLDIGVHKEGGNFFGPLMAGGFAPTHPAECPQWGAWCEWIDSLGTTGVEPPQRIKELSRMWDDVVFAPSRAEMMSAWQRLSERIADELPVIGVMTSPGQPVYVKRGFRNVPKLALAGWIAHQPGNCAPEAFFWEEGAE